MFSGIIEATSVITKMTEIGAANQAASLVRIELDRPSHFNDIKPGDSIAVDGVCLTLESFTEQTMQFALGFETLKILQMDPAQLIGRKVNLERSLRFGDRMHGHLVSGHVEALGHLMARRFEGESLILQVGVPKSLRPSLWKKGSVTLQGVSLTVNEVLDDSFEVCLIPETLKQTNLKDFKVGDVLHLETDYLAKALFERWKFWTKESQP